jgi:hypothetical protein
MNKTSIFTAILFSCLTLKTAAQEEKWTPDPSYSDDIRHKEIIMNTTPLIAQFVPFNASTVSKLNLFDFQIRRLRNGRGTRWGLGVNIDAGFNPAEVQSLYLRYGFVKKRQIAERFHYARSWDINMIVEDIDGTGVKGKFGFSGIGISYSAGFEYSINSKLTISTEGSFFFGFFGGFDPTPKIKFLPPVGLFLHVKL